MIYLISSTSRKFNKFEKQDSPSIASLQLYIKAQTRQYRKGEVRTKLEAVSEFLNR